MKEEKEGILPKILIPVAVTVLTAVILYFLRIDPTGHKIKDDITITDTVQAPSPNPQTPHPVRKPNDRTTSVSNASFPFTGLVVDEQGQPVDNVKVICDSKEGLTDAAGRFIILLEHDPGNKDMLVSLFKAGYSSPPFEKRNNETYLFPRK
ncbi:MAG: hypothetical protein IPM81_01925 [Saprospirales bacterium]|nr:hypothetical protein [Saprospirales bacterium]